jgi:hypothetical protein
MDVGEGIAVSVERGVSDEATVAGRGTGVSVDEGIASVVGEEQEIRRRMQKAESRLVLSEGEGMRVTACLCMRGF